MNKWLICIALILSTSVVQASKPFYNSGKIVSINATTIGFEDLFYLLSPTVKVWTFKKEKTSLKALKPGDYVTLKIIPFGKKKLVEHIYISPFGRRK